MNVYIFILLILVFLLTFVLPTYLVYRRTKINPITFGVEDNAHNFIGKIFKILLALTFFAAASHAFFPIFYENYLIPINFLETETTFWIGLVSLHLSIIWIVIAQIQMDKNWRIGIDENNSVELVTSGLFSFSRNPIFLGMIIMFFSIFCIMPSILTFFVAFTGKIVIQIQIRLEEEFLQKKFASKYLHYKSKTRRLI